MSLYYLVKLFSRQAYLGGEWTASGALVDAETYNRTQNYIRTSWVQ
jgi:hypothetical protein